jgi:hypothetical protein
MKTAAERQAKCRKQRESAGPEQDGDRRINTWVRTSAQLALARIARREKATIRAVLERLITVEDDKNLAAMVLGSPEWDAYFEKD